MDMIDALSTTTRVADTVTRVAMYEWNKKSLIRLGITAVVLFGATAVIYYVSTKKKPV